MRSPFRVARALRLAAHALVAVWLLAALTAESPAAARQDAGGPIYVAEADGIVTSVTIDYLRRALQIAEASQADALVITLGSGGGVLAEMRPFAVELARAQVPVVVYVTPGTQSGAAGAFFLSAAHVGALAPDTSFGSPFPLAQVDETLSQQTRDLVLDSASAQLRQWNEARGRSVEWVDRAVRDGAVLTNEQAITGDPPAVDLVAASLDDLLLRLEGRQVTLDSGRTVAITTLGRQTAPIEPTLFERLRLALADPTVAFALLVLGAMAIYLELASPGTWVFAGFGLVLLLGASAGLIVLPVRVWAMALLVLALLLIGAEFFVPTHGGLTIAGLALLTLGALNMIDAAQAPGAGVSLWAVVFVAAGVAVAVGVGLLLALYSRGRPVATGREALVGQIGEVRRRLDPRGMIFVDGALWQAISEDGVVEAGDYVRVTAVHNLQLIVRPLDAEEQARSSPEA